MNRVKKGQSISMGLLSLIASILSFKGGLLGLFCACVSLIGGLIAVISKDNELSKRKQIIILIMGSLAILISIISIIIYFVFKK